MNMQRKLKFGEGKKQLKDMHDACSKGEACLKSRSKKESS